MKKQKESELKKMMKLGMGMGVSHLALSSFPANPITPQVSEGYVKVAGAFPAMGTLIGTGMLVKQSKKLIKSTKKLKL